MTAIRRLMARRDGWRTATATAVIGGAMLVVVVVWLVVSSRTDNAALRDELAEVTAALDDARGLAAEAADERAASTETTEQLRVQVAVLAAEVARLGGDPDVIVVEGSQGGGGDRGPPGSPGDDGSPPGDGRRPDRPPTTTTTTQPPPECEGIELLGRCL